MSTYVIIMYIIIHSTVKLNKFYFLVRIICVLIHIHTYSHIKSKIVLKTVLCKCLFSGNIVNSGS